jgi:hypothetical protein
LDPAPEATVGAASSSPAQVSPVINRLFGKSAPEQKPTRPTIPANWPSIEGLSMDPCLGDPAIHEWHKQLAAGDDERFRSYLMTEPDKIRRDVTLAAVLEAMPARADWIDRWVESEPENPVARLARGTNLVDWAWEARGHYRAKFTAPEQFNQFFARLQAAWTDFELAQSVASEAASAAALMIDAAKGLQLGVERGLELYETVQARLPWHPTAHESIIQLLAPKWSHSTTEMWALARKVTREAPAASPVHGVIADAHIETWIELPKDEGARYWQDRAVRADVIGTAERSVDAAPADRSRPMQRARCSFAFCYARMAEREHLRRQFDAIGPFVGGPLLYTSVPLHQTAEIRRWAYGGPGR